MYLAIALTVVFLLPLIVSSLTICAPKWYRERVQPHTPHMPEILTPWEPVNRVLDYLDRPVEDTPVVWLFKGPGIAIAFVLVVIFGTAAWLLSAWITACAALIINKCPYTSRVDREMSKWNGWLSEWDRCKAGPVAYIKRLLA